MRTRNYFKYLLAAIVAIGTSVNVMAQEKNLRLYFDRYTSGAVGNPQLIMKGDVPDKMEVTQEGFKWASNYLATAFNKPNCEDRVWAVKENENRSHATLNFTNFKYEVKEVGWNRMNDVLSTQLLEKLKNSFQDIHFWEIGKQWEALLNFLSAFEYKATFKPLDELEQSKSVTGGSWFVLNKQMSFERASLINNAKLAGLQSISLEEYYRREQKLEDYCRIYLKAGVNNDNADPNINDYAFNITYYEPSVSINNPSSMFRGMSNDIDYTINHPGAFKFTLKSCTSNNTDVISIGSNGKMYANKVGKSTIVIKLKDGDKEISISKEIEVKDMVVNLYNNYTDLDWTKFGEVKNVGYAQKMPDINPPTSINVLGSTYVFLGFYDARDGGNCYYGADGKSVRDWDKTSNANLYAHWNSVGSNIYTITFVANGGTISSGIQSEYIPSSIDKDHYKLQLSSNNSIMTAFVQKNGSFSRSFTTNDGLIISKEGYEFLGWFTSPTLGEGVKVYIISNNRFETPKVTTDYWKRENNSNQPPKWHGTSSVTLYAQWKPKYVFGDGVVTFNEGANIETTAEINGEVVNDIRGAVTDIIAKEVKQADKNQRDPIVENIISVIDLTKSNSSSGKFDTDSFMPYIEGNKHAQTGDSKVLSPNLLVFVNNTEDEDNVYDNLISDWQCQNLVVTDRYPMKIPYGFNAKKATYERNKDQIGTNDAMWQQSYNSVWGTLCLPYPITNNHSYRDESGIDYQIRFYELYGTHDNYMQFREMAGNQKIEANTPVLYCRTAGVGSAVTVQESSSSGVEVPANIENGQYKVNSVLYSNELREEMKRNENAERVVEEDWQFKGTLETKKFCTKAYSDLCIQKGAQAEFLAGAEVLDPDNEKIPYREIYYFKQDKFTHMTSGVTILPYRAYFDRKKIEESTDQIGESKVSSYSILVMDADGTTTDITNLIDNHEAKGNGKIYDLSGRRVKQPVKGSIYIVDGKKKMY